MGRNLIERIPLIGLTVLSLNACGMAPAWRGTTSQQHLEQTTDHVHKEPLQQPRHSEIPKLPYGAFLDLQDGKPVVSEYPILFALTIFAQDSLLPIFVGEEKAYAGSFSPETVRARHGIPIFGIPKFPDHILDTTRIVPLTSGSITVVGNVLMLLTNEQGHPTAPDGTLLTRPNSPTYFVDLGNIRETIRIGTPT